MTTSAFNPWRQTTEATREENAERLSEVRMKLAERVPEFIVLRHDGTEHAICADISEAGDRMRALGNGACVVGPDGTLYRYMADALRQDQAERLARKAVSAWREVMGMVTQCV